MHFSTKVLRPTWKPSTYFPLINQSRSHLLCRLYLSWTQWRHDTAHFNIPSLSPSSHFLKQHELHRRLPVAAASSAPVCPPCAAPALLPWAWCSDTVPWVPLSCPPLLCLLPSHRAVAPCPRTLSDSLQRWFNCHPLPFLLPQATAGVWSSLLSPTSEPHQP